MEALSCVDTDRKEIKLIQERRFLEQIKFVAEHSPYYKRIFAENNLTMDDFTCLADITRIPFIDKKLMGESQEKHPPYGEFLCQPEENYIRYFMTSGTTATPRSFIYTARDWYDVACGSFARIALSAGVTARDRVFIAFGYGTFTGFWCAHHGFEQVGALVYSGGGFSSVDRLRVMQSVRATVLAATPTYALNLLEVAKAEGINVKEIGLKKIFVAGEPGGSIPETRNKLEEEWGVKVYDTYGNAEVQINTAGECTEQNGLHLPEDWLIAEVIDKDGNVLPPGQKGELVISNIVGKSMTVLRYRTGDLVVLDDTPCACGRHTARIKGVSGRTDDMVLFKGVNILPSGVESVIRKIDEVGSEFQILFEGEIGKDRMIIKVEPHDGDDCPENVERIKKKVTGEIKYAIEVTPEVQVVPAGSLPRFELKAKRVFDNRKR